MREFTTPSFPVYMYDADGAYTVKTMGEVCDLLWLAVIMTNFFSCYRTHLAQMICLGEFKASCCD